VIVSALCFACPHCAHRYVDSLELLSLGDEPADFLCERCHTSFALFLLECRRCGAEDATTWPSEPAAAMPRACPTCGHESDADVEEDSLW